MPYNENNIDYSLDNPTPFYPGTTTRVTHSFDERITDAEFDDALCDQAPWKNPRYDGCKLQAKYINRYVRTNENIITAEEDGLHGTSSGDYLGQYVHVSSSEHVGFVWGGDTSYQEMPVILNQSTALYIADTIIGGQESPLYVDVKNHSYVGISKILICNIIDNTVQVLDATTEPFEEFHRFITNDFSTGNKCIVKILDEESGNMVPNNLKSFHYVKMNKGFLLKTFSFKSGGEQHIQTSQTASLGLGDDDPYVQTANNTMYLYKSADIVDNYFYTGAFQDPDEVGTSEQLRFRFALHEIFALSTPATKDYPSWNIKDMGPSFASSSIHQNKFTTQYYSGSYGFLKHQPAGSTNAAILNSTALASASRFMAVDTLNHLKQNIESTTLSQEEKTEVHFTFFQGTKDFAPGKNDERSIATFEVDQQQFPLFIEQGDQCNGGVPTSHEVVFKGHFDNRFIPITNTYKDTFFSSHLESTASSGVNGCVSPDTGTNSSLMEAGINIDKIEDADVFVQGGVLGPVGYDGSVSRSSPDYGDTLLTSMNTDNFYSGSFSYEVSFLDKSHTLIMDLDKSAELVNGSGNSGLLLLPQTLHASVAFNLSYWLAKAGVISAESAPNTIQSVNPNLAPPGMSLETD